MKLKNILGLLAILTGSFLVINFIYSKVALRQFDLKNLPCYPGVRLFEFRSENTMRVICGNDKTKETWEEVWQKDQTVWTLIKFIETDLE